MKFGKIMLIALGLGLVTVVLGFLTGNPRPAQAGPAATSVIVTNTPLPVSGNVSAAVTGTVAASQNGAWNVGINNFPSFPATQNVSFNGVAQPVSFANTLSTPIFNTDRDNPAKQPVSGTCHYQNPGNGGFIVCPVTLITNPGFVSTVPAGQRLVIETVTASVIMPTGILPVNLNIAGNLNGGGLGAFIAPQKVGALNTTQDLYMVTEPVRIYLDPGSTVEVQVLATTTDQVTVDLHFWGYLVNLP